MKTWRMEIQSSRGHFSFTKGYPSFELNVLLMKRQQSLEKHVTSCEIGNSTVHTMPDMIFSLCTGYEQPTEI